MTNIEARSDLTLLAYSCQSLIKLVQSLHGIVQLKPRYLKLDVDTYCWSKQLSDSLPPSSSLALL